MNYAIEHDETGEVFTFTTDQMFLMVKHAPGQTARDSLMDVLKEGNCVRVNRDTFYHFCYLAARVWLDLMEDAPSLQA
jgi:hypothetical protein